MIFLHSKEATGLFRGQPVSEGPSREAHAIPSHMSSPTSRREVSVKPHPIVVTSQK